MQRRWFWSPVVSRDSEAQLLGIVCLLCSFNEDIPIPIVIEDAGVDEVVLLVQSRSFSIRLDEVFVWEFPLREFVEELHVRVLRAELAAYRR